MKNGYSRFDFYLIQLEELLAKASKEKDPGAYLYANDARTVMFMLEGLAKLYEGIHNPKKFHKIREQAKQLEDALGAIDYYDAFAKEFINNASIPVTITAYFKTQAAEKTALFNKILIEEGWLGKDADRIRKIRKKLSEAAWLKEKQEVKGIENFYHESIESIKVMVLESEKGFTELEEEVHELRRELRWLSIYPKALQGVIQLTDSKTVDARIDRYLTPEIVNSPFNKMPEPGDNTVFLLLEKNNFLALSWMISALGKLKDSGLKFYALTEALEQTESMENATALRIAGELLGSGEHTIDRILLQASDICKDYFEGKFLDYIVHGIKNV
ncbi:hypothetical protein [Ferruginibacter sp. HRS2-29]|uniref:hypothetical protein n=1 Tax=Ferruginibacter sp. HRS2-29 TaxID=2487334 RepID=UPI0020CC5A3E|nr:hypothetical protein [Ferruginibacter sp. HRS2-29]MCP9750032.1 hypothetical protein [Ferruginibacter sp. HRS2-29]